MKPAKAFLMGASLGANAVYWLDPRQGARRRALVRDRAVRVAGEVEHTVAVGARDLSHRLHGAMAGTRGRVRLDVVPDDVLEARVRAALGHAVSHPHAVKVHARNGEIELVGPIFEHEVPRLLNRVCRIHGVTCIDNNLEPHPRDTRLASLQGEGRLRITGARSITPATRLVLGWTGLATLVLTARELLVTLSALFAASVAAREGARRRSIAASRAARALKKRETPPPTAPEHAPPTPPT